MYRTVFGPHAINRKFLIAHRAPARLDTMSDIMPGPVRFLSWGLFVEEGGRKNSLPKPFETAILLNPEKKEIFVKSAPLLEERDGGQIIVSGNTIVSSFVSLDVDQALVDDCK